MVIENEVNRQFRKLIESDPTLRALFTVRQPAYRYFRQLPCQDQYFWTVEPIKYKGKLRYASGIYKYIASKKSFKLTQARYHAKRKDAKARAWKLSNKTR